MLPSGGGGEEGSPVRSSRRQRKPTMAAATAVARQMVGLLATTGQHGIRLFGTRVCQHELQLSDLVAGQHRTGEIVAFEPEIDAEFFAPAPQWLQRRGQSGEIDPGRIG